jgi:aminopeptidase-like protein
VQPAQLAGSLQACLEIFEILEQDRVYLNQKPQGEPRLSKYGLYEAIGGSADTPALQTALLWVLNLSDGQNTLLQIAERAELPFRQVARAADLLCKHGLLKQA